MIYNRTLQNNNGSASIIIPKEGLAWIHAEIGEEILLQDHEDRNKRRYLTIYKQQEEEEKK
jgi:antitoxin component of MazEF toxin-antitoxin module